MESPLLSGPVTLPRYADWGIVNVMPVKLVESQELTR